MTDDENRPYANQEHRMTDEPDGWYRRPELDPTALYEWDGRRWTGAWMPSLEWG